MRRRPEISGKFVLAEPQRLPEHPVGLGQILSLERDRQICRSNEESGSGGPSIKGKAGSTGRPNTRSADGVLTRGSGCRSDAVMGRRQACDVNVHSVSRRDPRRVDMKSDRPSKPAVVVRERTRRRRSAACRCDDIPVAVTTRSG